MKRIVSIPVVIAVAFAASDCSHAGGLTPSNVTCDSSHELLAGLSLKRAKPNENLRPASGVAAEAYSSASISGNCVEAIVGADVDQLLSRSGIVVDLLEMQRDDGSYKLGIHSGSSSFDLAGTTGRSKTSIDKSFDFTSDTIDFSSAADRHVGVRNAGGTATIAFVDIDRSTKAVNVIPLFEMAGAVRSVYYFPAPDAQAGTVTVLSGDSRTVTWVAVDR